MAYIALYRKWRPKTFEDVVGQGHITKTLQKAIDTDKVAHAYLFSGPRGTGKTSTAKIFARAMNCVHGPTSHPCNECEACLHIMNGESLDVVEIDAASNRSIEDIRSLRETIKFMPAEGKKRVYIIDEVHMLTTEAFNALLKTLEEPPAHVIFILATTEPEKIPMTILSRCQRYEFRRITSQDIAERLLYVAKQEQIDLTVGAAHILAVQADGGMRDALSMLDQCVSNADGTIDETLVRNLLGLVGRDWIFSLADAVFHNKGDVIVKSVDDIVRFGKEPRVILTELLTHLRALMLYQAAPASDTLAAYADSRDELAKQADSVSKEQVFHILGILQEALVTAKNSPVPRVAVEMGLLRASEPVVSPAAATGSSEMLPVLQALTDRVTRLEQALAKGLPVQASKAGTEQEEIPLPEDEFYQPVEPLYDPFDDAGLVAAPAETPHRQAPAKPKAAPKDVAAAPPATTEVTQPVKTAPAPEAMPAGSAAGGQTVPPGQYMAIWKQVCQILQKEKQLQVLSCVRLGHVVYIGATEVIISLKSAFMVKRANREDYYKFVDQALAQVIGRGYHMQAYQENDPALADFEKKNTKTTLMSSPAPSIAEPMAPAVNAAAPEEEAESLQAVTLQDIPEQEREVLEPLLKTLGDCHIYVENK
ncbi:DNA polymerase III subunit gamma/tau [Megasphaera hominis]|jgi:DNA polymerase-3 subunit gamma/tau|uniref:DNA-directed DNA polymerase n=1 Tax=Megasphaera hominis TaxID=159836 RepID=A0ABR6VGH1_9FIRM|nr:DNA polymerase III subunit gamma/tau [Megasphaera hominis]MBC3536369.1 DNA polymerase III subunit gamma/tau [Megasphaera hominis]